MSVNSEPVEFWGAIVTQRAPLPAGAERAAAAGADFFDSTRAGALALALALDALDALDAREAVAAALRGRAAPAPPVWT